MKRLTKSQKIGQKAISALTATALVFGGATVVSTAVAPAAVAQQTATATSTSTSTTFQPSFPANDLERMQWQEAGLLNSFNSSIGWGWCTDISSRTPQQADSSSYELDRLDSYTRYVPGGGDPKTYYFNSGSSFDADVRKALISLTKRAKDAVEKGDFTTATKVNMAMRVFAGHTVNSTTRAAWAILHDGKDNWWGTSGRSFTVPTPSEFAQWTGFQLHLNGNYPYYTRMDNVKIPWADQIKDSDYITVAVPKGFSLNTSGSFDTYPQRLITISQPGITIIGGGGGGETGGGETGGGESGGGGTVIEHQEFHYSETHITIDNSVVINNNYNFNIGDIKIVQGNTYINYYINQNGQIVLTPTGGAGQTVVISIVDSSGNTHYYTYIIDGKPAQPIDIKNYYYNYTIIGGNSKVINFPGQYTIIQGKELIYDIEQGSGGYIIKPRPGAQGVVIIEVTDSQGNKYQYTINVDYRINVVTQTITLDHNSTGKQSGTITIGYGNTWHIESGTDIINVINQNGVLIVTPKDGKSGTAVIVIKDSNGNVVGRYTIIVNYKTVTNTVNINITDKEQTSLPYPSGSSYQIIGGNTNVDVKIVNNTLVVIPREGASGITTIVVRDQYGNSTTYIINITKTTPSVPQTQVIKYNMSAIQELNFNYVNIAGYTTRVVSGSDIADVTIINGQVVVKPKTPQSQGVVVIETKDAQGNVIFRYEITVTKVETTSVTSTIRIKDTDTFQAGKLPEGGKVVIVEGSDKLSYEIVNGVIVFKPVKGSEGTAKVVITDKYGNEQIINVIIWKEQIVLPETQKIPLSIFVGQEGSFTFSSTSKTRIVSGGEFIDLTVVGDKATFKGIKAGTAVIEVYETLESGEHVWVEYTITVKEQQKTILENTNEITIWDTQEVNIPAPEGSEVVFDGDKELISEKQENGQITVTPVKGANGTIKYIVTTDYGNGLVTKNTTIIHIKPTADEPETPVTQEIVDYMPANEVREYTYSFESGFTYEVTEGTDIAHVELKDGEIKVDPKTWSSEGTVVVEVKDSNGNVVYRFTIHVIPVPNTEENYSIRIQDIATYDWDKTNLDNVDEDGIKIVEGSDKLTYEIVDGKIVFKPFKGTTGFAKVVITDKDGNKQIINVEIWKEALEFQEIPLEIFVGQSGSFTFSSTSKTRIVSGREFIDFSTNGTQATFKGIKVGTAVIEVFEELESGEHVWVEYTIKVKEQEQKVLESTNEITIWDTQVITLPAADGSTIEVSEGWDKFLKYENKNGTITVTPIKGANGQVTFVVTKDLGNGVITKNTTIINIRPTGESQRQVIEIERFIKDTQTVSFTYQTGWNAPRITQGSNLGSIKVENGLLVVTPNEGSNGTMIIEATDKDGVVVRYTVHISTSPKEEQIDTYGEYTVHITTRETWSVLRSATTKIVYANDSYRNLFDLKFDGEKWIVVPKPGVTGVGVVHEVDGNGKIINKYTINITNAHLTAIEEYNLRDEEITITHTSNTSLRFVQGESLVTVTKVNGKWVLTPVKGANGTVIVEEYENTEAGWVVKRYILNINNPEVATPVSFIYKTITNEDTVRITADSTHRLEVVEGQTLVNLTGGAGSWTLKAVNDSVTGNVRIAEKTSDGKKTVKEYIINIIDLQQGSGVDVEKETIIIKDGSSTPVKPGSGNTVVIVDREGADKIADIDGSETTGWLITPKPGTAGGTIIVQEKDKDGKVIKETHITIEKQSDKPSSGGTIIITKPDGSQGEIKDGDTVKPGDSFIIDSKDKPKLPDGYGEPEDLGDGKWKIVVPEGAKPGDITVTQDGKQITINVNVEGQGTVTPGGDTTINNNSSKGDGSAERCFQNGSSASNPMLWLLPIGLLLGIGGPAFSIILSQAGSAFGEFGAASGNTLRDEFGNGRRGVRDNRPQWMKDIAAQANNLNRSLAAIHPQAGNLLGVAGAAAGIAMLAASFAVSCQEGGWDALSSKDEKPADADKPAEEEKPADEEKPAAE